LSSPRITSANQLLWFLRYQHRIGLLLGLFPFSSGKDRCRTIPDFQLVFPLGVLALVRFEVKFLGPNLGSPPPPSTGRIFDLSPLLESFPFLAQRFPGSGPIGRGSEYEIVPQHFEQSFSSFPCGLAFSEIFFFATYWRFVIAVPGFCLSPPLLISQAVWTPVPPMVVAIFVFVSLFSPNLGRPTLRIVPDPTGVTQVENFPPSPRLYLRILPLSEFAFSSSNFPVLRVTTRFDQLLLRRL